MTISSKTKRMLLARSGGYCQNPRCNIDLYPYFKDGSITNIEELAHIIAKKEGGARGDEPLPLDQRNEYNNIILLCPTCHTIIDKNPDKYPSEVLKTWKREHEEKIKSNFHVPKYKNRSELRLEIQKLLAENNEIFRQYGPHSDFAKSSDQSEASKMWEIRSIETIIPNNRKIYELLNKNYYLLSDKERMIFFKFREHKEGFEYNKLSGDKNSTVPLFPNEINEILK